MKKLLLVLAFVVACSAMASAQVPKPFSLYAGGLISMPQSPDEFKDNFKTGWHFQVGFGWKAAPNLQVVPKIEYQNFAIDYDESPVFSTTYGIEGGNSKMWLFGADGRYSFGLPAAPLKPFALGGFGLANISQSDFEGTDPLVTAYNAASESQTKFYWNIGGGVDLKTGPAWSLYAQLRYVSVATEGDSFGFIPLTLGVKFF
jgi:opacity protein-like surface antigen